MMTALFLILHFLLLIATLGAAIVGLYPLAIVDGMVFLLLFAVWALFPQEKKADNKKTSS